MKGSFWLAKPPSWTRTVLGFFYCADRLLVWIRRRPPGQSGVKSAQVDLNRNLSPEPKLPNDLGQVAGAPAEGLELALAADARRLVHRDFRDA